MTHQARRTRSAALTRKALMMSCASAALATAAVVPQAARAQAFQGSITATTGSVTRSMSSATTETITIGSNTATINWNGIPPHATGVEPSGTIDFLPSGNTATFTSTQGITDYTVLNRILPSQGQPIALNGHVISTLQGTATTGGNIWFYSPGGIVIGATAVFNVGGLLLTTNDVTSFGTTANGFSASFSGPAGSASRIQIQNGAQINALQQNSYVALVAPRIEQGGKVRVDGTAAYAAGEQLSMTMNQGLFDIQVDVGTSDPNGIVHTGETSGTANTSAGDNHSIYMVAVPKNQALTMLLSGGTVGFDEASSAQVQNGQIILSSGYSISGTGFDDANRGGAIGGTPAGIMISGGQYRSSVNAMATGSIDASGGGGTLNFAHDVSLQGLQSARLTAHDGETITVAGGLTLSADDLRYFTGSSESDQVDAQGGYAALLSETGGSITIAGSAAVTANASPTVNLVTNYGGTSTGGTATVDADGGNISIGGNLTVSATAFGDGVGNAGFDGRDSWGGDANVFATGASLHVGGNLNMVAEGDGSASALSSGGTGGTGHGGDIEISADDSGSIEIDGTTRASASGIGGTLLTSTDGTGGEGNGGEIDVASVFGASITFGGNADFLANGIGQSTVAQGGDGYGGDNASLFIDGGTITANGYLAMYADGVGGNGLVAGDGYGGSAFAGITGIEGAALGGTLNVAGDFRLQGSGHGGNGINNAQGVGGQGGDGYGGSAFFYVSPDQDAESSISVHLADVFVTSNGEGGAGGDGLTGGSGGSGYSYGFFGEGEGFFFGDARIQIWAGNVTAHDMQVFSTARGGNGGAGSAGAGGAGGDAYGGSSDLTVGGDLTATRALSYDRALAGNGGSGTTQGDGGFAEGGDASIDVVEGGHLTGAVDIATNAFGGTGNTGGGADGGFSSLTVEGALTGTDVTIASTAVGGNGAVAGGDADGGSSNLDVFGGTMTFSGTALVDVGAIGGNASNGSGGFASGGFADVESTEGGGLTGGDLTGNANATGGNGTFAGGAIGGEIDLMADSWSSGETTGMSFGQLNLTANGRVGSGGIGGETSGSGGGITIQGDGGSISANLLSVEASGSNFGGFIDLESNLGFDDLKGALHFGGVNAIANGEDSAGFILVATGAGSTIGLGTANLTANGGFGGSIFLLAGACSECGGEGAAAAQSPALPAGGGIAATDLTLNTTGNIFMELSGGADISVSGTLKGDAGQFISMFDDGSGGAIRAHEIDLSAVLIDDTADIVADIIKFTSAGTMTLGDLSATNTMALTAGGDLITGDLSAGNALTLAAGNNAETGDLSAQTVKLTAAGDTSVADVHAPGSATFTAGGLASFTGIVSSPTITVTSSDIDIADNASLGVFGVTNLITLNAISHGLPIIIGDGPAAEGQYHLGEEGDIRSASLVINALGSSEGSNPDVKIFDTRIEGSTTSGGGVGNITLNTGGSVFVEGHVDFINAGSSDKLTINASHAIQVNTDTGRIVITDSAGHLAGTLALNGANIWIASQALLTQLQADPNFTGRDSALAANAGTTNPDGFVRAGTITAGVGSSFFVQNSGTADLFAGIDTGDGGLTIASTGTTPAVVVIYGRQTNSNGTAVTNQDFIGSVDLAGTVGFTNDSAVNGCAIGGTCGQPPATPGIDMASILGPLDEANGPSDEDKKKKDKDSDEGDDGSSVDPSLRLINTTPINLGHTIDEPVTSGGDVVIGGGGPVQPN